MFDETTIRLLDGRIVPVDEILELMKDDEYYYGYLGKAALSSSSAKLLYKSPKKYANSLLYEQKMTPALRDGNLLHTMVLEPHMLDSRYEVVSLSSRTTKSFKEAENNTDKIVMLEKEYRGITWLKKAIDECNEASSMFTGGVPEEPMIGNLFGLPFRGKADYLRSDCIVDLKTTSDIVSWKYTSKKVWHYDMQAYIYSKLFGVSNFIFVVVEKGSGDIDIVEVSPATFDSGEEKLSNAVANYNNYVRSNASKQYVRRYSI